MCEVEVRGGGLNTSSTIPVVTTMSICVRRGNFGKGTGEAEEAKGNGSASSVRSRWIVRSHRRVMSMHSRPFSFVSWNVFSSYCAAL